MVTTGVTSFFGSGIIIPKINCQICNDSTDHMEDALIC